MLGIVLIYFLGKAFYDLAGQHGRNKWGYAVAGVVSYYFGTFVIGIVLYLGLDLFGVNVDEMNDLVLNFLAIPFGLLACWLYYKFLEKKFETTAIIVGAEDILDDEFRNEA